MEWDGVSRPDRYYKTTVILMEVEEEISRSGNLFLCFACC